MAIGMSPHEYWEENPYLAQSYYKAYQLKLDIKNHELWLQGLYFFDAVSIALSNAFGKRVHKYPQKPYDFKTTTEEAQNEAVAQKERDKAIEAFKAMRKRWETEHGNTGT